MAEARKVIRLEVEFTRRQTIEFDLPNVSTAASHDQVIHIILREMWTRTYHERRSTDESVNFQQWKVVDLCDPDHQGFEYEHAKWVSVPPFSSVDKCSRCGREIGK